jgi:hypothetical protein
MGNKNYEGGVETFQQVVALGVSNVTTQTKVVGAIPKNCRLRAIRFYGQGAVTATSLTAECFARTTAGATGVTMQTAAKDIKFGTAAAGLAGVAAVVATGTGQYTDKQQLVEVVVTADTCTAGPGDFLVVVEYEPR